MPTLDTLTITEEQHSIDTPNIRNDVAQRTITYAGPPGSFNPQGIANQLSTLSGTPLIELDLDGSWVRVHIPLTDNREIVDSIIADHDASVKTQIQLNDEQHQTDTATFKTTVTAVLADLEEHKTNLNDSPTNAEVLAAVRTLISAMLILIKLIRHQL